ncbi:hypothetical protein AB4345_05360 [Vibrio breoganii]
MKKAKQRQHRTRYKRQYEAIHKKRLEKAKAHLTGADQPITKDGALVL